MTTLLLADKKQVFEPGALRKIKSDKVDIEDLAECSVCGVNTQYSYKKYDTCEKCTVKVSIMKWLLILVSFVGINLYAWFFLPWIFN